MVMDYCWDGGGNFDDGNPRGYFARLCAAREAGAEFLPLTFSHTGLPCPTAWILDLLDATSLSFGQILFTPLSGCIWWGSLGSRKIACLLVRSHTKKDKGKQSFTRRTIAATPFSHPTVSSLTDYSIQERKFSWRGWRAS